MESDKYSEKQKQTLMFLENVISRCFQEKLDATDIVMFFMRTMDKHLRKDGLMMYIGPYHKDEQK